LAGAAPASRAELPPEPDVGFSCSGGPAPLKPDHRLREFAVMLGIAAIVIFLLVIAGLNLYEFGRLD
jgi:hypothetical protein